MPKISPEEQTAHWSVLVAQAVSEADPEDAARALAHQINQIPANQQMLVLISAVLGLGQAVQKLAAELAKDGSTVAWAHPADPRPPRRGGLD